MINAVKIQVQNTNCQNCLFYQCSNLKKVGIWSGPGRGEKREKLCCCCCYRSLLFSLSAAAAEEKEERSAAAAAREEWSELAAQIPTIFLFLNFWTLTAWTPVPLLAVNNKRWWIFEHLYRVTTYFFLNAHKPARNPTIPDLETAHCPSSSPSYSPLS